MAVLGIGMTFAIGDLLARITVSRRVLAYLGGMTLGIYCVHGMWRNIGVGDGALKVITMTLVAMLLSVALIWLLKRFRFTDYVFLGNSRRFSTGYLTGKQVFSPGRLGSIIRNFRRLPREASQ